MVMIGATFLLCAGIILMFFPLLNPALEDLLESSIRKMKEAKKVEATTIARLMVLEFSQLKSLLKAQPKAETKDEKEVDQRIKNLIWEKVTFNEVIEGIELIKAQSNSQKQHLTYYFYRREDPDLIPMSGPQKEMKKFTGEEKELLEDITERQTVDLELQKIVNIAPKTEGQMLLRYLPVHVLVPEAGAIYWGVAKIGIDVSGLPQLQALQSQKEVSLRKAFWLAIILSLTVSGILAVSLLYIWARSLTEPLRTLGAVASDFKAVKPEDYDLWLENLRRVESLDQKEVSDLQETLIRLGRAVPRLGERLFASEHQACLSRIVARALPVLLADGKKLADWQRFAVDPEGDWQTFDLTPILASAWRLITLGAPQEAHLTCEVDTLPPVWGSWGYLAQAVLYLLEYAAGVLSADGQLTLTAGPLPTGGLQMVVSVSGPTFSSRDCRELLRPLEKGADFDGSLGPALAAAIALQHEGELTAQPGEPSGLRFTLQLPPLPTDHGNHEPTT